jgi:NAD-dependent deacetylase
MKNWVVLTGAGISADSGIRTFRDQNGLWEDHDVMEVASLAGWRKNPERVLQFYNARRRQVVTALPNPAHQLLAKLQDQVEVHIITQNVDDLHEKAGSQRILHLHGQIMQMRSEFNEGMVSRIESDMVWGDRAPDGAQWRPDIVWFGEAVPLMELAVYWVGQADLFTVIGTSLEVYPAASLVDFVQPGVPCAVLDPNIPRHSFLPYWHRIPLGAAAGAAALEQWVLDHL